MPSFLQFAYKDSYVQNGGSTFSGGQTHRYDAPEVAGANEFASVLHYTAPVGTSYEQIYTALGAGDDNFGGISTTDTVMIINRSTTDTLTLRFNGVGGDNAYVTVPAGRHFILYGTIVLTSVSASDVTVGPVDAKFTSGTGTVEVIAGSLNAAFS